MVAHAGDGELQLAPAVGAEFSGSALPSGWTSTPWDAGGAATVAGGRVSVDGTLLGTTATYAPGRSLEFVATFANEPFQHVGLGTDLNGAPWAIFSTGSGGTTLLARTNSGSDSTDTVLGSNLLGAPHLFRIDWQASQVVYSVDGVQVASHALAIGTQMRPVASDAQRERDDRLASTGSRCRPSGARAPSCRA